MGFVKSLPQKLTLDLDEGRINSDPAVVVEDDGRKTVFYEKFWSSGRTSDSRVTFTTGTLNVQVEAGSGSIKGVSVTWSVTNLTVPANSYTLIYAATDNQIYQTDDFPMDLINDVIILAFVNAGTTAIAGLEEIEKTGRYIFMQRQIFVGSTYTWEDYEYRLNSGEQPVASFDSVNNKIYLTYKRDQSSYFRIFDLTDSTTFTYLFSFQIAAATISLDPDPESSTGFSHGSGSSQVQDITPPLFTIEAVGSGFKFIWGEYLPYIHIPYVGGSYTSRINSPVTLEVLTKSGTEYSVEKTYTITTTNNPILWEFWDGTFGIKYLRIRLLHTLFSGEYVTEESNYVEVAIREFRDYTELESPTEYNSEIKASIFDFGAGSGNSSKEKTLELVQSFTSERDDDPYAFSHGSGSSTKEKTLELLQSFTSERDDTPYGFSHGSGNSLIEKTSEVPI